MLKIGKFIEVETSLYETFQKRIVRRIKLEFYVYAL